MQLLEIPVTICELGSISPSFTDKESEVHVI